MSLTKNDISTRSLENIKIFILKLLCQREIESISLKELHKEVEEEFPGIHPNAIRGALGRLKIIKKEEKTAEGKKYYFALDRIVKRARKRGLTTNKPVQNDIERIEPVQAEIANETDISTRKEAQLIFRTVVEEGRCELCGEERWLGWEFSEGGKRKIICCQCAEKLEVVEP